MKRATVIKCDKVKMDERRRQVVYSLSPQSSEESLTRVAQKRPKLLRRQAPEERRRRISSFVLTPAGLVRKGSDTMIRKVMDAIYQSVGGLDVHQETVVACRRRLIGNGQAELEVKTFKTRER